MLDGVAHDFRTRTGTDVPAIESVDLTIDPGQFVAIVGPSGCGKTTLLRIAGGLISPSRGTVRYRGEAISGPVDDLGIVFQAHELLEWRTVLKNITIQSEIRRLGSPEERRAQALDLLRRVHLEGYEGRYPFELSGGQQQRVALCRALIHDPGMLLMDEPFGALDAFTREQLQADLESMWMLKRPTVIFITHDVTEAVTLADRVVVMTGSLPGRLAKSEVNVPVERPRRGRFLEIPELQQCALKIRQILTTGVAAERV